jgi:hypothetical protein
MAEQKTLAEYAVFFARGYYRPYIVKARQSGAQLGPQRYLELTYADHKSDPTRTIRRVVDFLGLPSTDDDVRMCIQRGDFKNQSGRKAGDERRDAFLRKGIVGDWRNHFTDEFGELLVRISRTPLDQSVEVWDPASIPALRDGAEGHREAPQGRSNADRSAAVEVVQSA